MTTLTGFLPLSLAGPAYRPSAYGLTAVVPMTDDGSLRWASGGTFLSNGTEDVVAGGTITDGCAAWQKQPTMGDNWLDGLTVILYGWWQCAPAGYTPAEAQARARDIFINGETMMLEDALWTFLTRDGEAAVVSEVEALAQAETQIAKVYGGEGVVHMSRAMATYLATHLTRVGSNLRTTAANTPVVVGDGYFHERSVAGSGPISIIRGPLTDLGPTVNQSVNDLDAVVERAYQILVDVPQGAAFEAPPAA